MKSPRKVTILLVDDDAAIRDSIRLALEDQAIINFTIHEAASVESGIELALQHVPKVIVLDLHMPGGTGFDFIDGISGDKKLANTKIIMLTADDNLGSIFTAEDKHISPYRFIGKPFNMSDLEAAIYEAAGLVHEN